MPVRSDSYAISTPRPARRLFSIEEANRSLVLVRKIVADIMSRYALAMDLQEMLDAAEIAGQSRQAQSTRTDLVATAERINRCVEELQAVGAELRDWTLGIVDFPAVMEGKEVCLCWQFGQQQVRYWHEVGAEPSSRRPLEEIAEKQVSKSR